jgi:hypothetical protein
LYVDNLRFSESVFQTLCQASYKPWFIDRAFDDTVLTPHLMQKAPVNEKLEAQNKISSEKTVELLLH